MEAIHLSASDIWQLVFWQKKYHIDPTLTLDESGQAVVEFGEVKFPLGKAVAKTPQGDTHEG